MIAIPARIFLDTYAIIEILEGNPRYQKFVGRDFVITKLNAIELHRHSLKNAGEVKAQSDLEMVWGSIADFGREVIADANKFRQRHKEKNLSIADCIGYVFAMKNRLAFITGDREFKGLAGVEFLSKD
ncbi:PIN domain-containing protein [Candidatus Woesearchaeota archaeon]|nr:PIN domain-containing protein [Candidatus Woesearchaeota archaeon]